VTIDYKIVHRCKVGAIVRVEGFLCSVGIHDWLSIGYLFPIAPFAELFECLRCHRREARYGYATVYADPPKDGWGDYLELNLERPEERNGG